MSQETITIIVQESGSDQVASKIGGIGTSAKSSESAVTLLNRALGAITGFALISELKNLNDEFQDFENRIRLVTNSQAELNAVTDALGEVSVKTRTNLEANAQLFYRLAEASGSAHLSYQQIIDIVQSVDQALIVSGTSTRQAKFAILDLAEGLSQGALQGRQLRSIVQFVPELANAIGSAFKGAGHEAGIAGSELLGFAKANPGIITTSKIIEGLQIYAARLNTEFQKTNVTFSQAFTQINSVLTLFVGKIEQSLGASTRLGAAVDFLRQNLAQLAAILAVIAGIAAFNTLTASLLGLGSVARFFLGFMTEGFFNLFAIIRSGFGIIPLIGIAIDIVKGSVLAFGIAFRSAFGLVPLVSALYEIIASGFGVFTAIRIAVEGIAFAFRAVGLAELYAIAPAATFGLVVGAALIGGTILIHEMATKWKGLGDTIAFLSEVASFTVRSIISLFVAAYQTVVSKWDELPDAFISIGTDAVNGLIGIFNKLFDYLPDKVNKLSDSINEALGTHLGHVITGDIPLLSKDPAVSKAGDDVSTSFWDSFEKTFDSMAGKTLPQVAKKAATDLVGYFKQFLPQDSKVLQNLLSGLFPDVNVSSGTEGKTKHKFDFTSALEQIREQDAALHQLSNGELSNTTALLTNNRALDEAQKLYEINKHLTSDFTDKTKLLTAAQREQIVVALEKLEADKNEIKVVQEINKGQIELANTTIGANAALKDGAITLQQYNDVMLKATITSLEGMRDMQSGFTLGLLEIKNQFTDFGKTASNAVTSSFSKIEDAFVQLSTTGKFNIKDLINSILVEFTKLSVQRTLAPLANFFGNNASGGGSFLNSLFSGDGQGSLGGLFSSFSNLFGGGGGGSPLSFAGGSQDVLPGFASGTDFMVGGAGVSDDQLVAFRGTPGERVTVTPRNGGGPGRAVTINQYIQTPDAQSFQRSSSQISAAAFQAAERAHFRNN